MAPGGRSAGLRLRAVASHLRSCPANSSEAQPSADTSLLDGAGQMAAEVLQPMSPSATAEEIVEALKTVGCALVPSVITPAAAARLGEISHGRCIYFHAPLYISFVILYTKQTGGS